MATRKNDDDIDYTAEGATPPHEKDDPTNAGYDEAAAPAPAATGPEGQGGVLARRAGGVSGGLHEVDDDGTNGTNGTNR
jgi:hypothetical protein